MCALVTGVQTCALPISSVLRIDVTSAPGTYRVPADNPFATESADEVRGLPEVWAYGLRNTWRFEFDPVTGDLWAGDVGQNDAEEVNILRAGGNYGWSAFEGPDCRIDSCDGTEATPPVTWYSHDEGCSVTGRSDERRGGKGCVRTVRSRG